jgi:hypothetical protein
MLIDHVGTVEHTGDFLGLPPTGREGTSVETMLLTIVGGRVTRIDVASNTADLVVYEYERGWPIPHNVRPPAMVDGVDRRAVRTPPTSRP